MYTMQQNLYKPHVRTNTRGKGKSILGSTIPKYSRDLNEYAFPKNIKPYLLIEKYL